MKSDEPRYYQDYIVIYRCGNEVYKGCIYAFSVQDCLFIFSQRRRHQSYEVLACFPMSEYMGENI